MRVRKEWKIIMRKQAWLAAAIFGCSVLMAGCGTADKSYQKGIQAMQAGKYEDAGKSGKSIEGRIEQSIILPMECI